MSVESTIAGWRNRISGGGEMPANQFLAHEMNARRHGGKQRDALRGSFNEVGWVAPVIVSQRSGKLLDGHARIEEVLSRDENALVPYIQVDVTPEEERIILATFDPITGLADYDRDVLTTLLGDTLIQDADLKTMIQELASHKGIFEGDNVSAIWQGMPEFNQPNGIFRTIIVHFDSQDDVDEFSRLVNQTFTDKTKYIWFPYKANENLKACLAVDEESELVS